MSIQKLIDLLPPKFRWSAHNIIGHPVCEILSWVGLNELGVKIHDATLPEIWIISNTVSDDPTFWSNELGWVDRAGATEFTRQEKLTLNLPIDGIWVESSGSIE